ncbi:MAG TPA: preprotein translocase subunit SecG [Bacillota bacterium]|nr:preprotein translocase subunit SecG [Bacillota bacterium]HPE38172.1 preprotein translocase subunit SecG [Bacillota bacterium]
MKILAYILTSFDILVCIALVVLVIFQEGNDNGLGVIGGGSDTFFDKQKGRTLDEKLKKITTVVVTLFAVLSISLFLIFARGF